jgi:CYTH domain-containing protein
VVTERQVSNALYETLLLQADPYRHTISKRRKSFIAGGQFFELDAYEAPHEGLMILETKGIACHADLLLPPFLRIVKDITGNFDYYNYNLALRK